MSAERRALVVRVLAESLLIVLSILLALWVDGWSERRDLEARRDQALGHIYREIESNLASIRAVAPYHDTVLAASRRLEADEEAWAGEPLMQVAARMAPRGLVPPDLRSTAWDAAVAAEAVPLFDFETASAVAAVYGWQEQGISATVQRIADRIFTPGSFDPAQTRQQIMLLGALLGELRSQELSLARQYERVLDHLRDIGVRGVEETMDSTGGANDDEGRGNE